MDKVLAITAIVLNVLLLCCFIFLPKWRQDAMKPLKRWKCLLNDLIFSKEGIKPPAIKQEEEDLYQKLFQAQNDVLYNAYNTDGMRAMTSEEKLDAVIDYVSDKVWKRGEYEKMKEAYARWKTLKTTFGKVEDKDEGNH